MNDEIRSKLSGVLTVLTNVMSELKETTHAHSATIAAAESYLLTAAEEMSFTGLDEVGQAEKEELTFPIYWRHDGSDEVGVVHDNDEYKMMMADPSSEIIDIIPEELYLELKAKADEPVKTKPAPTLEDVRDAITAVMKADKTKKGALFALLKTHGAERVSELEESTFADVLAGIKKIAKGEK